MEGATKDESLPPGFRFHPTDEELITHYLARKTAERSFSARAIAEVDLNKCEPWELQGKAKMGEKEWYFFSLRDRKYPTGVRTNRATTAGYWKTTGKDKEIFADLAKSTSITTADQPVVGMKKTLVFYKGRAPRGEKTSWVMHEYRLHSKPSASSGPRTTKDEWVVCRVFMKSSSGSKKYTTAATTRSSSGGLHLLHPSYAAAGLDMHMNMILQAQASNSPAVYQYHHQQLPAMDHHHHQYPFNLQQAAHGHHNLIPRQITASSRGNANILQPQLGFAGNGAALLPPAALNLSANASMMQLQRAMAAAAPPLQVDHHQAPQHMLPPPPLAAVGVQGNYPNIGDVANVDVGVAAGGGMRFPNVDEAAVQAQCVDPLEVLWSTCQY